MDVQVMVSTMHQKTPELLARMNLVSDAVVINQCNKNGRKTFERNGYHVLWINTTERGISRSRNMALRNAWAEICIFADDDEEFMPDYPQTVCQAFEENPGCSFLRFQVKGIERKFKNYPGQEHKIGYLSSMKISSVELAVRRRDILEKHLWFDERIGAGTKYMMGEENAFVFGCLSESLQGKYIPRKISDLHMGNSTWFKGYNREYFVGKGAGFTAMSRTWAELLIWQFALRKRRLYRDRFTMSEVVRLMRQGKKEYLKLAQSAQQKENRE